MTTSKDTPSLVLSLDATYIHYIVGSTLFHLQYTAGGTVALVQNEEQESVKYASSRDYVAG